MNILSSTIHSFIKILTETARNEKKLEFLKERLCNIETFEPYSVFKMLDKEGKGYLNKEDFRRIFQENNIFISESKIKTYFIDHHDRDKDEKINYTEFLKSILPKDHPVLRTIVTQRPTHHYNKETELKIKIEKALCDYIQADIKNNEELSFNFSNLIKHEEKDFTKKLFCLIDKKSSDFVDFLNLTEFFKNNDYFPFDEETTIIIRKFDSKNDGKLNYEEFSSIFANNRVSLSFQLHSVKDIKDKKTFQSPFYSLDPLKKSQFPTVSKLPSKFEIAEIRNMIDQKILDKYANYSKTARASKYNIKSSYDYYNIPSQTLKTPKTIISSLGFESEKKKDEERKETKLFEPFEKIKFLKKQITSPPTKLIKSPSDFAKNLESILSLERKSTELKNKLNEQQQFNSEILFEYLDEQKNGVLNIVDFENFCNNEINLNKNKDEISLVIARYSKTNTGSLSKDDFEKIFGEKKKKEEILNYENFSNEVKNLIVELISFEIQKESEIEKMRQAIYKHEKINMNEIFKEIDLNSDGFIDSSELKLYLQSNEITKNEEEMTLLIERFDYDRDGKICFSDFSLGLTPQLKIES